MRGTSRSPSSTVTPTGRRDSYPFGHRTSRTTSARGVWRCTPPRIGSAWVDPAPSSPIVRRAKAPATVYFITDGAGKQETRDTLAESRRWLWFRPEVVMALAHPRGGSLGWYTRDTGSLACAPGSAVHF